MQKRRKKILVVEDEAITAMNMVDMLELWGYEVCEPAVSGEEALTRAKEEKPELVLMDINIRGEMGGIETAVRMRNDFAVTVLFITGYADSEIRKLADAARPAGYLLKPFDPEKLKSLVAKALR
jgi:CheY-like chemotaxis protein